MSNDHFSIVDEAISPQPWMQLRPVAAKEAASVSRSYATSGGGNKNDLVQTVDVKWTNNTPIMQGVYGMVTRGGTQVALQARSRGFLSSSHAAKVTGSATTPTHELVEVSRCGCGLDIGLNGTLTLGTGFGVQEFRQHSSTIPLMPQETGLYAVAPGETFHAQVVVRFVSQRWEDTAIDGGGSGSESGFISGDTRIDLFALPADITPPPPRPVPTVLGIEYDIANGSGTTVSVPAGTAEGDTILAVVANQFAVASDISAVESGWTLWHNRDAGLANAHLKVYRRVATADEPDTYSFRNGFAAEETAALITIRDASPRVEDGWQIASALRRHWWERDTGHAAPSFDSNGQLLLAVSYVPYAGGQDPILQTPPEGMTELLDVNGSTSTLAIAALTAPPKPTGQRKFVTSKTPQWAGQSVAVSILVPGVVT